MTTARRISTPDRITNVGAVAFIAGLVTWYAGASDAIDRTLSAANFFYAASALGVFAALIALVVQRSWKKGDLGNAIFLAAGIAFVTFNCVALLNRHADTSQRHSETGNVLSFATPSKGPRAIHIALATNHISLHAHSAPGCNIGNVAVVALRAGALGATWVENVRCTD